MFEQEKELVKNLKDIKAYCKGHLCSNCALVHPVDGCFFDHTEAGSPSDWDLIEPREPKIPSIFPIEK